MGLAVVNESDPLIMDGCVCWRASLHCLSPIFLLLSSSPNSKMNSSSFVAASTWPHAAGLHFGSDENRKHERMGLMDAVIMNVMEHGGVG